MLEVLYFNTPNVTHIDIQPDFFKIRQSRSCHSATRLVVAKDEVKLCSLVVCSNTIYASPKFVFAFARDEVLSLFLMWQTMSRQASYYLVVKQGFFLLYGLLAEKFLERFLFLDNALSLP